MPGKIRYYAVVLEHLPPGEENPAQRVSGIRIHCKVNRIPAYDPEEACQKALNFLLIQGRKGVRVKSVREQGEGSNGQAYQIQP